MSAPSRRTVIAAALVASALPVEAAPAKPDRVHGRVYWGARALVQQTEIQPDEAKDMVAVKASIVSALRDLAHDLEQSEFSIATVNLKFKRP